MRYAKRTSTFVVRSLDDESVYSAECDDDADAVSVADRLRASAPDGAEVLVYAPMLRDAAARLPQ